mmetsp:Transcript_41040/g.89674  ORF Transcript_41040/g.89674 Transcript_41040/m.89674 type:complete len:126 (+) Transcript_41040:52-429(+)
MSAFSQGCLEERQPSSPDEGPEQYPNSGKSGRQAFCEMRPRRERQPSAATSDSPSDFVTGRPSAPHFSPQLGALESSHDLRQECGERHLQPAVTSGRGSWGSAWCATAERFVLGGLEGRRAAHAV